MFRRYATRQFAALSEYNYRVFFCGQAVSLIGTWMQAIGQGWFVLQLTRSPAALGVVTMLQMVPFTLLSLVGGVLADRLPKRKTLIIVQSLALLQAVTMFVIVAAGVGQVWHIYVLAFLLGTTNAIERPTRQSFFSELVPREKLVNAVALNSSILNAARVIGPSLGGIMIALAGVKGTFAFNACTFLAVLIGYGLMRPAQFYAKKRAPANASIGSQIAEGLRYAARSSTVTQTLMLVGFISLFGYNFNVTVPLIAEFVLRVGPEKFGLLTSFLGLGSFVAAFAIAGLGTQSTRMLYGAALGFCTVFLLVSVSTNYWVTSAMLVLLGLAGVAMMTMANTSLQLNAPEELRGRVISIFVLLQAGSTPIGGMLTGLLSEWAGVRPALFILGLLCFGGVGVTAVVRSLRARSAGVSARIEPSPALEQP
ncbi:MAG TPA: MFS transporter [Tepidiformaceae bacterium]|nr:MFS transporter [Tepidiformaceae bacterium]